MSTVTGHRGAAAMRGRVERRACLTVRAAGGFSLVELMIAVAVVAILATIAYPAYERYVTSTWRAKAAGCLTELAQGMERRFTANMSYVNGGLPPNTCVGEFISSNPVRYVFSFQNGEPTDNAFVLQAVPQNVQAARDTLCGIMRVNQLGVKTVTGTAGNAGECL